jgi:TolB protein
MRKPARHDRRPSPASFFSIVSALWSLCAITLAAQARPTDGRIVFTSDRGGQSDIWVMGADGTNPVKLTDDKIEDDFAAWSEDGKLIAWLRGGRGPEGEIWVMNADGSGKRQVTFNGFSDSNPTFAPDGSKLAFRSFRNNNRDIYVIHVDGTGEQRLTSDPASDFGPDWSPDGSEIAFTSLRSGHSAIWVMNADGSGQHQLTADEQEAALPGWSPDGTKILYSDGFCATCGESDLFVMNADGSGVTPITNSPENELSKSWTRSATGAVADFSPLTPSGTHLSKGDIVVIEVSSGAVTNLTNTPGISEEHPDCSTGGRPVVMGDAMLPDPVGANAIAAEAPAVRPATNPGRGLTTLTYALPRSAHVRLRIFDVAGHQVADLVNEWQPAGTHAATFSRERCSGVYFYRLEWEGGIASGKLSLLP